ncbi:MAG: hypothetical protein N2645_20715 [Clostridia bacterium]|nr:hypothetical protein [Clostridia bacterium]
MDYFLLKQDERYKDVPHLHQISKKMDVRYLNHQDVHKLEDTILLNVKATSESSYLDLLDRQLFIASDKLKKIMEKCQPDAVFKTIILIDPERKRQEKYFLPVFERLDGLISNSGFAGEKSMMTKLVLKKESLKGKRIFCVSDGVKSMVILRLDAAESILRRYFTGICLERVLIED